MSSPEQRLADLGLAIPDVMKPMAAYVPAVRTGPYVHTSGQLPLREGELIATGKVGGAVTTEQAYECARLCALNGLGTLKAEIGELSAVTRVVKALVFISSTTDFTQHPQVGNGASNLLNDVFGDVGQHARSAIGVAVLPLDAPVELELIFEVSPPTT